MSLTYPQVGATRNAGPLPAGYHHLRYRTCLGRVPLAAAGDAIVGWRMHRAAGTRIEASAPRAAPGVEVSVGLGVGRLRLTAPCRVVWSVEEDDRVGFAYGTLPGHPEHGEESFVAERAADARVWFAVTAFSRPARWYTRAAGPAVVLFQQAYVRRLGRVLRRLCGSAAA